MADRCGIPDYFDLPGDGTPNWTLWKQKFDEGIRIYNTFQFNEGEETNKLSEILRSKEIRETDLIRRKPCEEENENADLEVNILSLYYANFPFIQWYRPNVSLQPVQSAILTELTLLIRESVGKRKNSKKATPTYFYINYLDSSYICVATMKKKVDR
ncbi:hypothetical protein Trydic_g3562 [Trypoxylus dichotomus]